MFQVGDLVRCPIDGEIALITEKKETANSAETPMYFTVYKVIWQGSELRNELHDPLVEWINESEVVSLEEYKRNQKDEESS